MSDILTLKETAEYLRVSGQTVYNMIKDRRIKAYKVGREWRFFRSDIMKYLESTSGNRILSTKDEEANKDKKGVILMQLSTEKFYEILNGVWDTGPEQTAEAKKMRSKNPDLAFKQGYYAALGDVLEQFEAVCESFSKGQRDY